MVVRQGFAAFAFVIAGIAEVADIMEPGIIDNAQQTIRYRDEIATSITVSETPFDSF